MVYGTSATGEWDKRDRNLLEAYQIIEDERCGECGNPVWLCRSDDSNITFKIEKDICFAKRAYEEATQDMSQYKTAKERNKARSKWGVIEYPKPVTLDETPLPTRRDFYERRTDKLSA